MPDTLLPILPHLPLFVLTLFRLTGIFIFAPLLSSAGIPVQLKALLALVLSFCVYPMIPPQPPADLGIGTLSLAIAGELLIGLVIGYAASLPLTALQLGGVLMGQQLGLGLARVYNPDFDEEVDTLSQLLYLLAMTVFLLLNGHHAVLSALVGSFRNIPLGVFAPEQSLVKMTVGLLTTSFELAVRVSAPLLCLVFLETIAMGFLAKTVPQLNIMSLGFPLRILVGFAIMMASVVAINEAFIESIQQAMRAVVRVLGG